MAGYRNLFREADRDLETRFGPSLVSILLAPEDSGNGRKVREQGTGFLVYCRGMLAIMTSAHVLPTYEAARHATVKFVIQRNASGANGGAPASDSMCLLPDKFFLSSPKPTPPDCLCDSMLCRCPVAAGCHVGALDYALCAIEDSVAGRNPIQLERSPRFMLPDASVYTLIATSESGAIRQVRGMRETVTRSTEFELAVLAATSAGTSGAPVFDDSLKLVGVHRAGGHEEWARCSAVPLGPIVRDILERMESRAMEDAGAGARAEAASAAAGALAGHVCTPAGFAVIGDEAPAPFEPFSPAFTRPRPQSPLLGAQPPSRISFVVKGALLGGVAGVARDGQAATRGADENGSKGGQDGSQLGPSIPAAERRACEQSRSPCVLRAIPVQPAEEQRQPTRPSSSASHEPSHSSASAAGGDAPDRAQARRSADRRALRPVGTPKHSPCVLQTEPLGQSERPGDPGPIPPLRSLPSEDSNVAASSPSEASNGLYLDDGSGQKPDAGVPSGAGPSTPPLGAGCGPEAGSPSQMPPGTEEQLAGGGVSPLAPPVRAAAAPRPLSEDAAHHAAGEPPGRASWAKMAPRDGGACALVWGLRLGCGRPGALRVLAVASGPLEGLVAPGDEISSVNGRALKGLRLADAAALIDETRDLALTICRRAHADAWDTVYATMV